MRKLIVSACAAFCLATGCASDWKIHGGPQECIEMCQGWNMELTGMVGVGSQDRTGGGSTACVCEIPRPGGQVPAGVAGTATSTGAIAVMLAQAQQQQQQQQAAAAAQ